MKKHAKKNREQSLPDDVSGLRGWRRSRPVADVTARPPARRITIYIDEDVIAIFKAEALRGGAPYQVAINQALRSYLTSREQSEHARAAELVLKALDDETVVERLRRVI